MSKGARQSCSGKPALAHRRIEAGRASQDLLGRRGAVAAPGDDLIRADQGEIRAVELARLLARQIDDGQVEAEARRGALERCARRRALAEPQQRPLEAEGVEQRAPVLEPEMRRATAGA